MFYPFIPIGLVAIFIVYIVYMLFKKDFKRLKPVLYIGLFFVVIWGGIYALLIRA